jgi:hypothetical protein
MAQADRSVQWYDPKGLELINRCDNALVDRGYVLQWTAQDDNAMTVVRAYIKRTMRDDQRSREIQYDERYLLISLRDGDLVESRFRVSGVDILKPVSYSIDTETMIDAID